MAEARNAVNFYVPKSEDVEAGYYTIKVPTMRTVVKASSLIFRRAKYQLAARLYPATPLTAVSVVGIVTSVTVSSGQDSWWRNSGLAHLLWKADNFINALNPLHRHFTVNTRVAYLAAIAAFTGMIGIVTVERILLRVCLHWKGWLYLPPGTKKKPISLILWAACVKILSGQKNLTYAFSMSLPSLPLPNLNSTCVRYLETVKPLLTEEEYEKTEIVTKNFLKNEGPKLQRYLRLKHLVSSNYVADWWEKYVYLRGRTPLMINSNYYVLDSTFKLIDDQIIRAASVVHEFLKFKDMVEDETLEPMVINGLVPLCMEQYNRMFGTTRVPGRECDSLKHCNSRYIVVMCHGFFYQLDVYHGVRGTHLKPYSATEILHQLRLIVEHSKKKLKAKLPRTPSKNSLLKSNRIQSYEDLVVLESMNKEHAGAGALLKDPCGECNETDIAAFTAGPRTRWAEVREVFFSEGVNRQSLKIIEKSAFILTLDDEKCEDVAGRARSLFHGNGANRWFDKSINLVVFKDGFCGMNAEHSWADAPALAHMWEHALLQEMIGFNKRGGEVFPETMEGGFDHLTAPKRLLWDFDDETTAVINQSKSFAREMIQDVDLELLEQKSYGKGFMKKCKISPDAFIQMALQLAYYADRGRFDLTYEASMTRLYRLGRTETVRSLSNESAAFVKAYYDQTVSKKEKVELLRNAAARHQSYYKNCMTGKGVDRHLFALYVVSKGMEIDSQFLNDALSVPWRLSTSQQPQQQTVLRKELPKEVAARFRSPGGGFGPVADDGYGVSYMIVGENDVFFHISSKVRAQETDSKRFAKNLLNAFKGLKELFEE